MFQLLGRFRNVTLIECLVCRQTGSNQKCCPTTIVQPPRRNMFYLCLRLKIWMSCSHHVFYGRGLRWLYRAFFTCSCRAVLLCLVNCACFVTCKSYVCLHWGYFLLGTINHFTTADVATVAWNSILKCVVFP